MKSRIRDAQLFWVVMACALSLPSMVLALRDREDVLAAAVR